MNKINKSGERADPCAVPVSMKMSVVSCAPTWSRGFVEKCEEAKHSPPLRAGEDAPVTAQHDVLRWARCW